MRPLVYVPFVVQLCFFALRIASIWKRNKQPWGLDDISFYISSVWAMTCPVICADRQGFTCGAGYWALTPSTGTASCVASDVDTRCVSAIDAPPTELEISDPKL